MIIRNNILKINFLQYNNKADICNLKVDIASIKKNKKKQRCGLPITCTLCQLVCVQTDARHRINAIRILIVCLVKN